VLVFYISGHGFGHASRSLEVIDAIARRSSGMPVAVRTATPAWFLNDGTDRPIDVATVDVDTGVVQIDSLRLDEEETARRAARFYADFGTRVEAEAALLRKLAARLVVGDIPPLAFAAAAEARVPSVALGNFTWDWIYESYATFEDRAPGVLQIIRNAYAQATHALRLPLHGGFGSLAGVVRDIPLIARHSPLGRANARRVLGLSSHERVVLASFGAYGAVLPYADIAAGASFTLVVTDAESPEDHSTQPARLRRYPRRALQRLGVRYPDLVAAADVVVSKPGYGIVSECIANGTALLYAFRGHFAEQDVFVAEMPRLLRCRSLSDETLRGGRWNDEVEALLGQEAPPQRLRSDGADVAADAILKLAAQRL
jgi:L-arabinokinase